MPFQPSTSPKLEPALPLNNPDFSQSVGPSQAINRSMVDWWIPMVSSGEDAFICSCRSEHQRGVQSWPRREFFCVLESKQNPHVRNLRVRDSESIDSLYFAMSTHFALHQFKSSECTLHWKPGKFLVLHLSLPMIRWSGSSSLTALWCPTYVVHWTAF